MLGHFEQLLAFQIRFVLVLSVIGEVLVKYGNKSRLDYAKEFVYLGEAMKWHVDTYLLGMGILAILCGGYLGGVWIYRRITKQTYNHNKNELYE